MTAEQMKGLKVGDAVWATWGESPGERVIEKVMPKTWVIRRPGSGKTSIARMGDMASYFCTRDEALDAMIARSRARKEFAEKSLAIADENLQRLLSEKKGGAK